MQRGSQIAQARQQGKLSWEAAFLPSSPDVALHPPVPQLAKTGYHTGLIHFVQYLMEKSVCMVSEGHVEPVDR